MANVFSTYLRIALVAMSNIDTSQTAAEEALQECSQATH